MTHRRRSRGDLLPQSWLDYRPPRHQTESHAVIEQRMATAGEHDRAPVDAGYALPSVTCRCSNPLSAAMCWAACASSRLRSVSSRFRERISRCPRRWASLFFEEVGALLQGLPSIAAKAVAQSLAAADQLLIQPGRADDAGLPFNRQMRFQFDRHAAQPLRVVLAATLGQVVRHLP